MQKDSVHIVQTNVPTERIQVPNFMLSAGSLQHQDKLRYRSFQDKEKGENFHEPT